MTSYLVMGKIIETVPEDAGSSVLMRVIKYLILESSTYTT